MSRRGAALLWLWAGCAAPPPPAGPERFPTDGGEVTHWLPAKAAHLDSCGAEGCGNELNPPTGGPHCQSWLPCRAFTTAQPRCQYLHNLEHGHAVLAYHCPQGCPEVVTALEALWRQQPVRGQARRALLTPDPKLPAKVAVLVWGWSYSGEWVDPEAVAQVLSHQDREAPEPNLLCEP